MQVFRLFLAVTFVAVMVPLADSQTPQLDNAHASRPQVVIDGDVQMTVFVSATSVPIATAILVAIEIEAPESASVFPPTYPDAFARFDVISQRSSVPLPIGRSRRVRRYEYEIESLIPGSYEIGSLTIAYQMPGMINGPRTISSRPIEINVESLLPLDADPMSFRDLKGELPTGLEKNNSLALIWNAALIAIVSSLAAWIFYRRRRRIGADHWALAELQRIQSDFDSQLVSRSDADAALASTMRRFVEFNEGKPALALSTTELIELVEQVEWPGEAALSLKKFLSRCDAQKFARRTLADDDSFGDSVDELRRVVAEVSDRRRLDVGAS